jgi:hypothetical protein
MFIVFNNYVLVPHFNLPEKTLDDHIWMLMDLGVGGSVAGRNLISNKYRYSAGTIHNHWF